MSTTRERVQRYLDAGLKVRDIAQLLGISTQAVYQHVKALDASAASGRDSAGAA